MALDITTVSKLVCKIPPGKVATYGQIAKLAGFSKHARQVGYLLARLPEDHNVPWHRVINAQGKISQRRKHGYQDFQRLLLEDEGIKIGVQGKIKLSDYLWQPDNTVQL